jgi:integrase
MCGAWARRARRAFLALSRFSLFGLLAESNPCRKVKKLRMANQGTRHLSLEEEDRLMAALSGRRSHLKPLVTVAIYTGMRRSELLKLRRSHVDFGLNIINVQQTKTGKDRTVPKPFMISRHFVDVLRFSRGTLGTIATYTNYRGVAETVRYPDGSGYNFNHNYSIGKLMSV